MRWSKVALSRARPLILLGATGALVRAVRADAPEGRSSSYVGTLLPSAPDLPPGSVAPDLSSPLTVARARASEGDWQGVITLLTPWLESKRAAGREKTAAQLLLGLAHLELENWNLASASFTRVRSSGGPLASYGAWYEAVVDHKRGRHSSAAGLCRQYRTTWPDGPEADNCLLLIGDAWAAAGNRGAAAVAYKEYLDKHPDTPRDEEIRLNIALSAALTNPTTGIPMLQELVISHSWHSTALSAQAALDELGRKGFDVALPTDLRTRERMTESARRCGRFDEAWASFQQIAKEAETDPAAAAWVEQNEDRISWGTRQYDVYAAALEKDYEASPSAELAWRIFVAWTREGDWKKAVTWERAAREAYPTHYRWKRPADEVLWAETLAGNYADAAKLWEGASKAGGERGQDARFYAAFSAYRAGDLAGAEAAFTTLLSRDSDWTIAATYWRSRVREAAGDAAGAAADQAQVRARDRYGWYRLLLHDADPSATEGWTRRDGAWHGGESPTLPTWKRPEAHATLATGLFASPAPIARSEDAEARAGLEAPPQGPDWSAIRWPMTPGGSAAPPPPAEESRPLPTLPMDVPDGYQACLYYDPVAAKKAYLQFSETNRALWPDLVASYELALASVYEESARLLTVAFGEWEKARGNPGDPDPRAAAIRGVKVTVEDWRQLFLFARNHHEAARFCAGLDRGATEEGDQLAARRLAWPIVRGADLWDFGHRYDVDPLLMMGLMRQESTYVSWARSPANAVGLVQVLPSTGARVAALLGEGRYSPGDLEIPRTNVRYGTYYFSLLMKRFDGVFPLAVASYNGGPHNVSRWYKGWHGQIPLDVFVEQIPYPETRDYVKRVTGYYSEYVRLYGPAGATVRLPEKPLGDDPSVVDF